MRKVLAVTIGLVLMACGLGDSWSSSSGTGQPWTPPVKWPSRTSCRPAAGPVAPRCRRDAASSTCAPQAGNHDFGSGRTVADLGVQRRLSRPDPARRRRRAGDGQRAQRSGREHDRALARHAPAGGHGRRPAPADARRAGTGRRPGRSTSRPRRSGTTRIRTATRATTCIGAWPGMFIVDDAAAPRWPAQDLRRRRHPGHRAGQEVRQRRRSSTTAGLSERPRRARRSDRRQRHRTRRTWT